MATITRLSVDLVANSAQFRKDLDKAQGKADKSFRAMSKSAKAATAAFAAVGAAAGKVFIDSAKEYGNFTEALSDVKAKTSASAKQIDVLSMSMRKAAKETRFTATQTAEAGTFLAQAGLNIREINEAIRPTLDLAAATKTGVQQTADFMTNIMRGMGLSTEELHRAADVLSVTTAKSNTNLTDLATAMTYAAPSMRAMGMSVEETSALIGMMANAGIKGSMAGTALRQSFVQLTTSGGVMASQIADGTGTMTRQTKALRKLGVESLNADGSVRKLTHLLVDLKRNGATEEDIIAIFGTRAGSAMMQFMNEGLSGAEQLTAQLNLAGGAAQRMATTQMDNLNGDITLLNSGLSELKLITAKAGIDKLFRDMSQLGKLMMTKFEPVLAKIAPYFDEIAVGLGTIAGGVILAGVIKLGIAMAALAFSPIGLVVLGVAALGIAVYKVTENFDYLAFHAKRIYKNMGIMGQNAAGRMKQDFLNMQNSFAQFQVKVQLGLAKFKGYFMDAFNEVLKVVAKKINKLLEFYNMIPFVDDATPITLNLDTDKTNTKIAKLKAELVELKKHTDDFKFALMDNSVFIPKQPEVEPDAPTDGSGGVMPADLSDPDTAGEKQKTFLDSIKMTATELESIFDAIESKASTVFTNILTGQQSLTDGFAELGETILSTVIGSFVEMAVAYVKQKALMFAMDALGLSTTAASTAAMGATIASTMAPAAAMTSLATAGGNSVPAMAGMTATHALSASQAVLGMFHDGIDNVPSTGTYLLESGERVVDNRLNKDLSSFLANQNSSNSVTNNPTLNFNVSGGDADNVERMLMEHRGKFEGMIRDIYNESAQNSPI